MNPVTKYFSRGSDELTDTLLLVIDTLLDAMQTNLAIGDEADHDRLCMAVGKLRRVFQELSTSTGARPSGQCAEILLEVGGVKRTIEEYNEQVLRFVLAKTTEFQKMLTAFTETVGAIAWANEGALTRLRDLTRRIAKVSMLEDLRAVCMQMGECLDSVRQESIGQREQAKQTLAELRYEVDSRARAALTATVPTEPRIDSLSGLPTRSEAEQEIGLVIQSGKAGFAVVFAVERVSIINARFGYAVGDQILQLFRQHLAENLGPLDRLFRWSGPVFLALLDRSNTPEQVRAEVKRIASAKLEKTVQIGSRSVLLPVSSVSEVISLYQVTSATDLIAAIDGSIAGALGASGSTVRLANATLTSATPTASRER